MSTAVDVTAGTASFGSVVSALFARLRGVTQCEYPLLLAPSPIRDLSVDGPLRFVLRGQGGNPAMAAVKPEDTVTAAQPLGTCLGDPVSLSPVAGTVKGQTEAPDLRGGKPWVAVEIEAAAEQPAAFEPLDAASASPDALRTRVADARILASGPQPQLLAELLQQAGDQAGDNSTLILLAADREPAIAVAAQLLRERADDVLSACRLLGRISGAPRVVLALPASLAAKVSSGADDGGIHIEILPLPERYPDTLEPMVAKRAGAEHAAVVPVECALAALDAVVQGTMPATKVITLVGRKQQLVGNFRVPLGARISEVLAAAKIRVRERDKVVAGGPMRGHAQISIEAAIDAGIDALMVIPQNALVPFGDEPCISCGGCIDVCPMRLQVQLLGRYSEFSLFDRTRDYAIDNCIECGLCASVCTARRPLLQLIRLAKNELRAAETAETNAIT